MMNLATYVIIILVIFNVKCCQDSTNYTNQNPPPIWALASNYWKYWVYERTVYSLDEKGEKTNTFKEFCRANVSSCSNYSIKDCQILREGQATTAKFEVVLNEYYDLSFQLILVLYCYFCGIFLIICGHFNWHDEDDIHYVKPPFGIKHHGYFNLPFTGEEVKLCIQTDSEDEQVIDGVNLSDFISESSEDERETRRNNPEEFGVLQSRKYMHEDQMIHSSQKRLRTIKRLPRRIPNINNFAYMTKIRSWNPPTSSWKKVDRFGVPKYPKIYEIRKTHQPSIFIKQLRGCFSVNEEVTIKTSMDRNDLDQKNLPVTESNNSKGIAFLEGAETGNIEILETLLKEDPTLISFTDEDEYTALHRASYTNQVGCTEFLLKNGGSIHAKTKDGWTPLHSAAKWNCYQVLEILLKHGANVNAKTHGGHTPLHLAASSAYSGESLTLLLLHPDTDVKIRNNVNDTSELIAQRSGAFAHLFELKRDSINNY